MARTVENCSMIKKFKVLGQEKPLQKNGKCKGYNNTYYQPDGKFECCDKCKLNDKNIE